jgi:hypothetical protein
MMDEIIFVVRESPEGGYEAHALGHSIFTEADTLEELRRQVQDAVQCHFPDESRPKIIHLSEPLNEAHSFYGVSGKFYT